MSPEPLSKKFDPSFLVWITIAVALLLLIVNPVYYLVQESFLISPEEGGGWTLQNFVIAFTQPEHLRPIYWTLVVSVLVGFLSLAVGAILAWCVSRTDVPYPGLIRNSVLISFVIPPFLGAIAWIFLAGPRMGWLNIIYRGIFRLGPDSFLFDIPRYMGAIKGFLTAPFISDHNTTDKQQPSQLTGVRS